MATISWLMDPVFPQHMVDRALEFGFWGAMGITLLKMLIMWGTMLLFITPLIPIAMAIIYRIYLKSLSPEERRQHWVKRRKAKVLRAQHTQPIPLAKGNVVYLSNYLSRKRA